MITPQELNLIKKQNRKKLEMILKRKDYQIKLAKKYYGDNYSVAFAGENHYENSQNKPRKKKK